MLGEAWDAMLDREYPSPAGTPRSGRGRMGVGANVPVGEVVIGPSPIDGKEGFTMVRCRGKDDWTLPFVRKTR